MAGCKHSRIRYINSDGSPRLTRGTAFAARCRSCDAVLSLGEADDGSDAVQFEKRAAAIAASPPGTDWPCVAMEGYHAVETAVDEPLHDDGADEMWWRAGYLARLIEDHL